MIGKVEAEVLFRYKSPKTMRWLGNVCLTENHREYRIVNPKYMQDDHHSSHMAPHTVQPHHSFMSQSNKGEMLHCLLVSQSISQTSQSVSQSVKQVSQSVSQAVSLTSQAVSHSVRMAGPGRLGGWLLSLQASQFSITGRLFRIPCPKGITHFTTQSSPDVRPLSIHYTQSVHNCNFQPTHCYIQYVFHLWFTYSCRGKGYDSSLATRVRTCLQLAQTQTLVQHD